MGIIAQGAQENKKGEQMNFLLAISIWQAKLLEMDIFCQNYCKAVYQIAKHTEAKNIIVNVHTDNKEIDCGGKMTVGCFDSKTRTIDIVANPLSVWGPPYTFERVLLHEIGHSTGIYDEQGAWNYAFNHLTN